MADPDSLIVFIDKTSTAYTFFLLKNANNSHPPTHTPPLLPTPTPLALPFPIANKKTSNNQKTHSHPLHSKIGSHASDVEGTGRTTWRTDHYFDNNSHNSVSA